MLTTLLILATALSAILPMFAQHREPGGKLSDIPPTDQPVYVPHATVIPADVPVPSKPVPVWKRWGPLEWGSVLGIVAGVFGGLIAIAKGTWGISMELHDHSRDITDIKQDQGEIKEVQKDQGRDTKKILWFLAEDYKHKNTDETLAPTTRPFLARGEIPIEGSTP